MFWFTKNTNDEISLLIQDVDGTIPMESIINSESKLKHFLLNPKSKSERNSIETARPTMMTAKERRLLVFSNF